MYEYPCPTEDRLIETIGSAVAIKQLSVSRVPDFISFVFGHYYRRFGPEAGWRNASREFDRYLKEELEYLPWGVYFVAEGRGGRWFGGVRGLRNESGIIFTTEKVFGLSCAEVATRFAVRPEEIWHGNQMVVDDAALRGMVAGVGARSVVKRLVFHLLGAVIQFNGRMMLAETDEAAERLYASYGMPWIPLTEYRQHIGWDRASAVTVSSILQSAKFRRTYRCQDLELLESLSSIPR